MASLTAQWIVPSRPWRMTRIQTRISRVHPTASIHQRGTQLRLCYCGVLRAGVPPAMLWRTRVPGHASASHPCTSLVPAHLRPTSLSWHAFAPWARPAFAPWARPAFAPSPGTPLPHRPGTPPPHRPGTMGPHPGTPQVPARLCPSSLPAASGSWHLAWISIDYMDIWKGRISYLNLDK